MISFLVSDVVGNPWGPLVSYSEEYIIERDKRINSSPESGPKKNGAVSRNSDPTPTLSQARLEHSTFMMMMMSIKDIIIIINLPLTSQGLLRSHSQTN